MQTPKSIVTQIPEPLFARFAFADTRMAWVWLIARMYVGWQWLEAGWNKFGSAAWTGDGAGSAVSGFLQKALQKTSGDHPDVQGWYAWFIEHVALPHADTISYLVVYGEIVVGIALILGIFTGIAAFFGVFMNANYLLAGTVSLNPVLFIVGIFLVLAWRVAGWVGIDRWLLPKLGVPWHHGAAAVRNKI